MIVLGIDQSISKSGYNLMNEKEELIAHGLVKTKTSVDNQYRIKHIYDELKKVIEEHSPDVIVIEDSFLSVYGKKKGFKGGGNVETVKTLNHVRGAIMLLAAQYDKKLEVITAVQAKKAITGSGKATKDEVIKAVKETYIVDKIDEHIADSIALSVTYIRR